jgi:hypothetical protein
MLGEKEQCKLSSAIVYGEENDAWMNKLRVEKAIREERERTKI